MPELLATFPELPLLIAVCAAAVLWRRVRRWLLGIAVTLVVVIVLGVFLHEAWEAAALGCLPLTRSVDADGAAAPSPTARRPA